MGTKRKEQRSGRRTTARDRRVAFHEAGHAALVLAYGLRLLEVTSKPDPEAGSGGHTLQAKPSCVLARALELLDSDLWLPLAESRVVEDLAGMVAEAWALGGGKNWVGGGQIRTGKAVMTALGSDLHGVYNLLGRMPGTVISDEGMDIREPWRRLFERTEREVCQLWPAICALANALQRKGTIKGGEARTIFKTALSRRMATAAARMARDRRNAAARCRRNLRWLERPPSWGRGGGGHASVS